MASATAAKVLALFSADELEREPTVAVVNETTCIGCMNCERVCPYGAVEKREIRARDGSVERVVADVNPGVCQGCGTCQAVCLSKSIELETLHRRADLRRDQRPGAVGLTMTDVRAPHHRLRLQLVHVHRRRPGRHQPPAHGEQRAHHPPALHGAHRPALHHQGVRARRRRRHRQRLPPGRLPLHGRQLPRPAPLRRLPRPHGLRRRRRRPHHLLVGLRFGGRQVARRGQRGRRQGPRAGSVHGLSRPQRPQRLRRPLRLGRRARGGERRRRLRERRRGGPRPVAGRDRREGGEA